jgi:hypothetical protein
MTAMQKQFLPTCGLVLLCLAATADKPRHVRDADALIDGISSDHNVYEHKGCFIKWKGIDGATDYENRTDCSDFLALLFEHSYGITTEQLKKWTGHERPYAHHWHDGIAASKGFTQIGKLADAKVGDVLAVKFPPGSNDTGHIMLIDQPPESIPAKPPIIPGTFQWNVMVIDSTKSPHSSDTRSHEDGSKGQGVGRGVVRIYTDSAGAVAGYCWSDASRSKFESQSEHDMVIGRLEASKSD